MTAITQQRPVRVAEVGAHEGPVHVAAEDALYFTSLPPRAVIKRLSLATGAVTVVPAAVSNPNGMALSADGRLLVCEQGSFARPARISLVDRRTGAISTLVDEVGGQALNSPNDVVVAGDGTVWFTDPSYGFLQGFRPRPRLGDGVYRHDPVRGTTALVGGGFGKPNGLVFAPDERTLYVGDSETGGIHAFDVRGESRLERHRTFAATAGGVPDGFEVDAAGRVYAATAAGVQVFDAAGRTVALLDVPGAVHLAWRGPGHDSLFITADTSIWAASTTHLQEA